ncbi:MAG: hypothetical protein FJX75_03830 [Armatimonadetes bacterium]|nr:hypothetical protein [Armatimonadota bacterium]
MRILLITPVMLAGASRLPAAVERPNPFPAYSPSPQEAADAQAALQAASDALTAGNLDEAQANARRASELIPTSAAPILLRALIAEQRGQTADAIDLYREALAWAPNAPRPLEALERLQAPRYTEVVTPYEDQFVRLINETRASLQLSTLKPHPALAEAARAHSEAMRDLDFFTHESPKPGCHTTMDRFLKRFDGYPSHIAENITRRYWRPGPALNEQNIALSHQEFLGSPGHRANLLGADFVYVGIGIAANAEGDYWVTELFMNPRPAKSMRMIVQPGNH